jgi:hypothetical protein
VRPYEEMDKITMPMTLVPEYQAMILKGFYDPERASSQKIEYKDCEYSFREPLKTEVFRGSLMLLTMRSCEIYAEKHYTEREKQ